VVTVAVPEWVASQRRDRGLCECCGQPGFGEWAGTGELLCEPCTVTRQRAADERFRD